MKDELKFLHIKKWNLNLESYPLHLESAKLWDTK
jgi:hypothetical protein